MDTLVSPTSPYGSPRSLTNWFNFGQFYPSVLRQMGLSATESKHLSERVGTIDFRGGTGLLTCLYVFIMAFYKLVRATFAYPLRKVLMFVEYHTTKRHPASLEQCAINGYINGSRNDARLRRLSVGIQHWVSPFVHASPVPFHCAPFTLLLRPRGSNWIQYY